MGKVFERVVIVFLENTMRSSALANDYLSELRKKGVFLTNLQGVTHPSQPNYIATIAGDTMGIADDHAHYMKWYWLQPSSQQANASTGGQYRYHEEGFSAPTIVDLLEAQNLSWKCYVEDLPPDAEYKDKLNFDFSLSPDENLKNVPPDVFPYARKHVPFLSFPSIVGNPKRLARIVNASEFETDLAQLTLPHQLPHYSFYVPNLLNDGHNVTKDIFRPASNNIDLGPDTPNLDNIEKFLKSFLGDDCHHVR